MKRIPIEELGCVTFTKYFKYLRGWISYSLHDNYNVKARISDASAAMGALNPFWNNNAVDDYSKYLIFVQYPSSGKFSGTLTTRFQLNSSRPGVTTRVKEEGFFRLTKRTWRRTSASSSQVPQRMVFSPHGYTSPSTTPTGYISFLN